MGELLLKIHEGMIILYGFSVLLYFFDFMQHNRKAKQWAFWFLSAVWLLQTGSLMMYMFKMNRFPILSLSEGLYFYVWLLITLSLAINYFFRVDFFVFFANVLGFVLLVIHTFAPSQWGSEITAETLQSELLIIHISISFLAYAAFGLSFIFSLLYMIQYHLLKKKRWGQHLIRLGNLQSLEKLSFRLNMAAVPLFLIGIILGLEWAYLKIANLNFFDWKIVGSFIVIAVYSFYLYVKTRKIAAGIKLAELNTAAFLIVLINLFLMGQLSTFHVWN